MITTRHWQLPISDLPPPPSSAPPPTKKASSTTTTHYDAANSEDAGLPPASTPTDHWVEEHMGDLDDVIPEIPPPTRHDDNDSAVLVNHSFMAPFADLLNFGPPCTKGRYDAETHSFVLTALCDFKKGQEVTFYYSDECDHVVSLCVCVALTTVT